METKNKTPTNNEIKAAIIKLRLDMHNMAKCKTMTKEQMLNHVYHQLYHILNL